jgi:DNA-binding NarL/FixJ family response regulator
MTSRQVSADLCRYVEDLCNEMVHAVGEATLDAVRTAFEQSPAAAGSPFSIDMHQLEPVLDRFARAHNLSRREAQILEASVLGVPRKYITSALGTGESTVKTQVKRLLKKTGHASVDDLVWHVRGAMAPRTNHR